MADREVSLCLFLNVPQADLSQPLNSWENQSPSTGGQGVGKKVMNRREHKGVLYLNVMSQSEHQTYITEGDKEVK